MPTKTQHKEIFSDHYNYYRDKRVVPLENRARTSFGPEGAVANSFGELWRSDAERNRMFQIPGYHEKRDKAAMEPYIPAEQVLNGCDEDALRALKAFAEGRARTEGDEEGTWKYTRREGRLECELVGLQKRCKKASALLWPDVPEDQRRTDLESVKKELAERLLRSFSDDPNKPPADHPCRLCDESFENHNALEEHIDDQHHGMTEYRKKLFALVEDAGPKAVPWEVQRRIISAFDKELLEPADDERARGESACVVCARLFWKHELKQVYLFSKPEAAAAEEEQEQKEDKEQGDASDSDEDSRRRGLSLDASKQVGFCRLLGVERYLGRWHHIAESDAARNEILASAVQHPYTGHLLLLHKRRVPYKPDPKDATKSVVDAETPCMVCKDCHGAFFNNKVPTMPRYALANDNWGGRLPRRCRT